jgi:hypothetical protein
MILRIYAITKERIHAYVEYGNFSFLYLPIEVVVDHELYKPEDVLNKIRFFEVSEVTVVDKKEQQDKTVVAFTFQFSFEIQQRHGRNSRRSTV